MKEKRKLQTYVLLFLIILFFIILITLLVVNYINNKEYVLSNKYSFSETRFTSFDLTEEEKVNINLFLDNRIYEDEYFFGFRDFDEEVDLYTVHAFLSIAKQLNNQDIINLFKPKLSFLVNYDYTNLGFLDTLYYTDICKTLEISFDYNKIEESLEKFYDIDVGLFFVNSKSDFINVKIIATLMCWETLSEIHASTKFNITNSLIDIFNKYSFKLPKDNQTLYNSGGDIIYTMNKLNLLEEMDLNNLKNWFDEWEHEYLEMDLNNLSTALVYSNFLDIAYIFDPNYNNYKLQTYYNELDENNLEEIKDYKMFYNVIRNINMNNINFNNQLIEKILSEIDTLDIIKKDISLAATVHGLLISKNSDFSYNKEKVKNFIAYNYNQLTLTENSESLINLLYYNVILDELVNNFHITCEEEIIQSYLNHILKSLDYNENIINEIRISRKAIELIADLQIHNYNVKITNKQKNKIENALKDFIKNKDNINNSLIIDIFLINDLLKLNLISNNEFLTIHNSLIKDNGNVIYKDDKIPADLFTTYMFQTCFDVIGNNQYLEQKIDFALSLKYEEGIYLPYSSSNKEEIDLYSILYGNSLAKLERQNEK